MTTAVVCLPKLLFARANHCGSVKTRQRSDHDVEQKVFVFLVAVTLLLLTRSN